MLLSTGSPGWQQRSQFFWKKGEAQYRAARQQRQLESLLGEKWRVSSAVPDTREMWRSGKPPATTPASSQWPFRLLGGGAEPLLCRWSRAAFDPQAHSSRNFRLENHEKRPSLLAVNQRKTPRPDGVRWCVLKDYTDQLVGVLRRILNQSPIRYSPSAKKKTTLTSRTTAPTCGNRTLPCEVLWGDKPGLTVLSLRRFRKIDFDKKLLVSFCQFSSEIMSGSVRVCGMSATQQKALQRVISTAVKISKCPLPSGNIRTCHILEITCLVQTWTRWMNVVGMG